MFFAGVVIMGISGLIPFIEQASTPINVKQLSGCRVAVDSYCWLHRGVYTCADKLIRGDDTDLYVHYCLRYVNMLLSRGIKIVMVFDGRHLPAKAETERRRRESRQEAKRLAKEHLRNNEIEKARSYMRRAVDVNHSMALKLMKACRQRANVQCLVAPYEADAQMAWLAKVGAVDYVITEDSDLTLFGAQRILFKLDLNGHGLLVEADKLHLAMGCATSVRKYTFEKFRRMCILSGCDYLDSLPGIGLKKACKFMMLTAEDDMRKALKKLPQYLKIKALEVTDEYIEMFLKAEATFRHMYIYNPMERRMERLNELEEFGTEEKYCSNAGELMKNEEQAFQLALGNLDPFTLSQVDNWNPDQDWAVNTEKIIQKNKKLNHKRDEFRIWQRKKDRQVLSGDTKENTDKDIFQMETFRNIEYKHSTEAEIEFQKTEERNKMTEVDVFTMYKFATQQQIAINNKNQDDANREKEGERPIREEATTPKKQQRNSIHNPFAKRSDQEQKVDDSSSPPVCANNSLLKVLSPQKTMNTHINSSPKIRREEIVEVRSRFFAENLRAVKRPLATQDLTQVMMEIQDTAKKRRMQQQQLYQLNSPPASPITKLNKVEIQTLCNEEAAEVDESKFSEIIPTNNKEKESNCLLIEEEEEERTLPITVLQGLQKRVKRCGLEKPSQAASKKTTTGKKIPDGTRQLTLAMFGFRKRPMLKNS